MLVASQNPQTLKLYCTDRRAILQAQNNQVFKIDSRLCVQCVSFSEMLRLISDECLQTSRQPRSIVNMALVNSLETGDAQRRPASSLHQTQPRTRNMRRS